MKQAIPLIGIVLMIILIPSAMGVIKTVDCFNNNTLRKYTNLSYCNGTTCFDYNLTEYVNCIYGCDDARMICTDYSGSPGVATPLPLFLAVEVVALILLAWSFLGMEPLQKMISALMSAILLFPMGLMSFNVLVGDIAMVFGWLGWLNFALAFVAVIMVIYAVFEHFRKELP